MLSHRDDAHARHRDDAFKHCNKRVSFSLTPEKKKGHRGPTTLFGVLILSIFLFVYMTIFLGRNSMLVFLQTDANDMKDDIPINSSTVNKNATSHPQESTGIDRKLPSTGADTTDGILVFPQTGANNMKDDIPINSSTDNKNAMPHPQESTGVERKLPSNGAKGLHSLTVQMQNKIPSLPPPQWPQLDQRTIQAIAEGLVLGVKDGSNLLEQNTIVSAYYSFKSKHSTDQYATWINHLLQTSNPMIIFVEPESEWFNIIKEKRSHAPTIIASQRFDDLVMSSTLTESFWQSQHAIDHEAKTHRGTGVYKIWNEKMIFLHAAIQLNPFGTTGFAWMDAGYYRHKSHAPSPNTPVVRLNLTEAGIPPEKVLFLHVRNDAVNSRGRVNLAGNAWFGSGRAFLKLYPRYYATFWDWIDSGKFIGSDQFVLTETCMRYRSSCHPFFPGGYRDWFALSRAVRGEKGEKLEVSPHFLFLDEPPKDGKTVPTGHKVTFCNNTVVAVDSDSVLEC